MPWTNSERRAYDADVKRRLGGPLLLTALAGIPLTMQVLSCTSDPTSQGGIFGDRPVGPADDEPDGDAKDATSDATDAPTDRDVRAPPPDAGGDA